MIKNEQLELGQFIPLHYHHNMLNDSARMQGFRRAIEHVVAPGARVLELGGGTGVLSHFAARHASQVWCVERNPEMVAAAREILALNEHGTKVTVVEGDAFDYLPPEPVDVVICEMLHVGLLREKQIGVIDSFKRRYLERFGGPLPAFVPEACIQAVQPVEQDFEFDGYYAPVLQFQNPLEMQPRTVDLGAPAVYQAFAYDEALPERCSWKGVLEISTPGTLNALRVVTKNILAILLDTRSTIDWHSHYLIVPLAEPVQVEAGERWEIEFDYAPGAPLRAFSDKLRLAPAAAEGQNAA